MKIVMQWSVAFLLLLQNVPVFSQTSIVTQHNDLNRTGWNNTETILNTSNVNSSTFGFLFSRAVDDQVFAQPLLVSNVTISGTKRNVVYVATVNNTIYAYDADSASLATPYWQINLTESGLRPPTHNDVGGTCGGTYLDFTSKIGIVGTPVIDTARNTLYVVARSMGTSGGNFQQFLHAIDIRTGADTKVQITAQVTGSGMGSSGGVVAFNAQTQNQRPGLMLLNGIIYIAYAAHCDVNPYHGWLLGYDEATLTQKLAFNTTPDDAEGGIWMSGAAPAADSQGNIYLASGNGDNAIGGTYYGESALKLTPNAGKTALSVSSYFSPYNYGALNGNDLDLGVTQVLLIPNTNLALTGCKDGNLYLMNKDNMGGLGTSSNNNQQTVVLGSNSNLHASFGYYKGASNEFVYVLSENSLLKAFPVDHTNNLLGTAINGVIQGPVGRTGGFIATSSNGSTASTGILWVSHSIAPCDANQQSCPGILRAVDANDVTKELWNSSLAAGDAVGNFAKFNCPTIANGKVYLASFSNKLMVYGLKTVNSCSTTNIASGKSASASSAVANQPAQNAVDGNISTFWSSNNTDNESLAINLGAPYSICEVVIHWDATNYGKSFNIQVSNDSVNWVTSQSITGNTSPDNTISLQATGYQFIRMQGVARNNGSGPYSIYEMQVYGTPTNTCIAPSSLVATSITQNTATLKWQTVASAASYNVQYKTAAATSWNSVTSTKDSVSISGLQCGTGYLFQVQTVCTSGQSGFTAGSFSTATCSVVCTLPTRWSQLDIGTVGLAGSACYTNGVYSLTGSGSDIGGTADNFQYANRDLTADEQFSARIATLDSVNPANKTGIMIREDLTPGGRNAFIGSTSQKGIFFQYRNIANGATTAIAGPVYKIPCWIKLLKNGTKYQAFASQDSINWTQVGPIVDLGFGTSSIYAGLAITSHDNTKLSAGTIDNFAELASPPLCVTPVNLTATHITQNSATLSWQKDTSALSYTVQYKTTSASAWTTITSNTDSVSISGLSCGTDYSFRILSTCAAGQTSFVNDSFYTAACNVACKLPVNLAATHITQNSATLSWQKDTSALSYTVQYKAASASSWTATTSNSDSVAIQGLTCGTEYLFRLLSTCASGQTSFVNDSFYTAACSIPCRLPANLAATNITQNSAILTWQKDTSALSYTVQYKTASASSWTAITGNTDSLSIQGLTCGTEYLFRILSTCASGQTSFVNDSFYTTACSIPCTLPANPAVKNIAQTTATLTWQNSASALSDSVQYKAAGDADWITLTTTTDSITLQGLSCGTGYLFQVKSICADSSQSAYAVNSFVTNGCAVTTTPSLPDSLLNFTGQRINNEFVQLQWTTAFESGLDHFDVERSNDSISFSLVTTVKAAGTSTATLNYSSSDMNPVDGYNYYRLKQVAANGSFIYSDTIRVKFESNPTPIIFPNPAKTSFTILKGTDPIKEIVLYDMLGKPITHISNVGSASSLIISVSALTPGVYIVQINAGTEVFRKKLLIQH